MSELRKKLFWHPVYGELIPIPTYKHKYEIKQAVEGTYSVTVKEPMETVYERDRRLWVEQAMLRDLVKENNYLTDEKILDLVKYYYKAYDLINQE